MPRFLNTEGKSLLGIGVCDRCHLKFPIIDLMPDKNFPGLRVCKRDSDQLDPWRLPARIPENIALPFTRPDVPIDGPPAPPAPDVRITEDERIRITEVGDVRITGIPE